MKKRDKKTPLGIKIISIYYFIVFLVIILSGFKLLTNVFNVLILIIVALIAISIGVSLWKGNVKARKIVLFLSGLSLINSVLNLLGNLDNPLQSIINIVIVIPIIVYLGFSKEVKDFFSVK